jgi:hypothetical protein
LTNFTDPSCVKSGDGARSGGALWKYPINTLSRPNLFSWVSPHCVRESLKTLKCLVATLRLHKGWSSHHPPNRLTLLFCHFCIPHSKRFSNNPQLPSPWFHRVHNHKSSSYLTPCQSLISNIMLFYWNNILYII